MTREAQVIVIGGGSAGAVIARRLVDGGDAAALGLELVLGEEVAA